MGNSDKKVGIFQFSAKFNIFLIYTQEKSSKNHQQTLKEVEDQKAAKKKAQERKVREMFNIAEKQMLGEKTP